MFRFVSCTSSRKTGSVMAVTEICKHYLKKETPRDSSKCLPVLEISSHIYTT